MKRCKEIEIMMGVDLNDPVDNKDRAAEKKQKPKNKKELPVVDSATQTKSEK